MTAGAVDDPDANLVLGVARGDAGACASLVDRYLPRVHGLAFRTLGDASEAEDVAQETFLRVWVEAARWKPGAARFSTWIYRVTYNLCIDRIRQRRPLVEDAIDAMTDPAPAASGLIARTETVTAVREALAQLPDRQRAAMALCHYEGLTNIEAAEVLAVSVDALESLLARARRALRMQLAPAYEQRDTDHE